MKTLATIFLILFLSTNVFAHIYWNPPTSYTDGSPVLDTNAEIQGYKLYLANVSMGYNIGVCTFIQGGTTNVYDTSTFPVGNYFAVLTAVSWENIESDFSNEVYFEIVSTPTPTPIPNPPPVPRKILKAPANVSKHQ